MLRTGFALLIVLLPIVFITLYNTALQVGHRPHTIEDKTINDDASATPSVHEVKADRSAERLPVADAPLQLKPQLLTIDVPGSADRQVATPPRPSKGYAVEPSRAPKPRPTPQWHQMKRQASVENVKTKTIQKLDSGAMRIAGGGNYRVKPPVRSTSTKAQKGSGSAGRPERSIATLLGDLQVSTGSRAAELVKLHRAAANVVYKHYVDQRTKTSKRGSGPARDQCFSMNQTEQSTYRLPAVLCVPAYVIIGFPKTGSTSLWNYMSQHPQVRVYYKKEAHFFHKPASFVRDPLPWYAYLRGYQKITADHLRKGVILGDHTPGYIWRVPWNCKYDSTHHFGCANRAFPINSTAVNIRVMIPRAKLVVLLRDPVDRAYSHFLHFEDPTNCEKRKRSPQCFHQKASDLVQKLSSCWAHEAGGNVWDPRCAWSPLGETAWMQNERALSLGLYFIFIKKWQEYFPSSQFCVLDLEHFATNIEQGMRMIEQCVGIKAHGGYKKTEINRRATKAGVQPMLDETRALLQTFYTPYNHALCRMKLHPIGCGPMWLRGYETAEGESLLEEVRVVGAGAVHGA